MLNDFFAALRTGYEQASEVIARISKLIKKFLKLYKEFKGGATEVEEEEE